SASAARAMFCPSRFAARLLRPWRSRSRRSSARTNGPGIGAGACPGRRVGVCSASTTGAWLGTQPADAYVGTRGGRPPYLETGGKAPQTEGSQATTEAVEGGEAGATQIAGAEGRPGPSGTLPLAQET